MMSELDVTDLQTNHVIYAGHLSGLGLLEDYVSSNSRFIIGINYDVIVDTKADQLYRSNLISLQENKQPVSFGVLSSFPLTSNTKLVTLTGTDDTGLIAISDIAASQNIMQQLGIDTDDMQENMIIETLFKVTGINSTDIDNELLVTDYRNLSDIELK